MIMQYSFLLDFDKVFKDKKYVICIDKTGDEAANVNNVKEIFENFQIDLYS